MADQIPSQFRVGIFDPKKVKFNEKDEFRKSPILALISPKFLRAGLVGKTCIPVCVFALLFMFLWGLYNMGLPSEKDCIKAQSLNQTASILCKLDYTRQRMEIKVTEMAAHHAVTLLVVTLLLGFYVKTMISRWWRQLCSMPDITDVACALNAFVKSGMLSQKTKNICAIFDKHSFHDHTFCV